MSAARAQPRVAGAWLNVEPDRTRKDLVSSTPAASPSLRRFTLTEQIVEWLSSRIISGDLAAGSPLNEVELAETLGCSRSPLREALRILALEGLVVINPGRGTLVSALDPHVAGEFYDTRALLESEATRLAVAAISPVEIARLNDIFAELSAAEQDGRIDDYQNRNADFHTTLYEACPNRTLVELVRNIWRRCLRYGQLLRHDRPRLTASIKRKQELLQRITRRDADAAAEIMRTIVLGGKDDVLRALTDGADDPYGYWSKQKD